MRVSQVAGRQSIVKQESLSSNNQTFKAGRSPIVSQNIFGQSIGSNNHTLKADQTIKATRAPIISRQTKKININDNVSPFTQASSQASQQPKKDKKKQKKNFTTQLPPQERV